jgi:hypothetical protein
MNWNNVKASGCGLILGTCCIGICQSGLTGYPVSNKDFNLAHPGHQEIMRTNIVVEFVQ